MWFCNEFVFVFFIVELIGFVFVFDVEFRVGIDIYVVYWVFFSLFFSSFIVLVMLVF